MRTFGERRARLRCTGLALRRIAVRNVALSAILANRGERGKDQARAIREPLPSACCAPAVDGPTHPAFSFNSAQRGWPFAKRSTKYVRTRRLPLGVNRHGSVAWARCLGSQRSSGGNEPHATVMCAGRFISTTAPHPAGSRARSASYG